MIELRNIHKYYNRGKSNEIHVINNTSLTFPETGLVTLLGPSGCGKTTLLNAIGGLDTIHSGEILYDGIKMSGKMIDEIRIRDVGFIYQNYILFPERSVYENLALTLRVFNLSEEEINRRIEYALQAVNMAKFKKRPARQLSGGQQQRVAIARALVKSPRLIIADEPTGNLDEKNTVQIMNIIKKLSKMCLVILVTHEKRLASFYADRIIELVDGKVVSDVLHTSSGSLAEKDESVIYLQDLAHLDFDQEDVNIRYFYEGEKPKLKLNIVFKNNTFYFSTEGMDPKQHYTMLGSDEQAILVDAHRPESPLEDAEAFDYDLPVLEKGRSKSAIAFKDALKMGFNYIRGLRFRKKLFLGVFFIASIMIPLSAATLSRGIVTDEHAFQTQHRQVVNIEEEWGMNFSYDDILEIENMETTSELVPLLDVYSSFRLTFFERSKYRNIGFSSHTTVPIELLKQNELVLGDVSFVNGVAQLAEDEIIVDQWLVEEMLETSLFSSSIFRQAGGTKPADLLGMKVYPQSYYGEELSQNPIATIVGIANSNNPAIFAHRSTTFRYMINDYAQSFNKSLFQSTSSTSAQNYVDSEGVNRLMSEANLAADEVIVSQALYDLTPTHQLDLFANEVVVLNMVGYVPSASDSNLILSELGIMDVGFRLLGQDAYNLKLLSANKEVTIAALANLDYVGVDTYEISKYYYTLSATQATAALLTFTGIVLSAALIFLYFTMRSSLIARIYEVGVYRALGIKKMDVYKIFSGEVVWITIFSSLIGFILASLVIANLTSVLSSALYYPWYAAVASLMVIIGLNFSIGLLPIFQLLRKSPAEILSKYDI